MNARRGLQMILAAVMFAALVPMVSAGIADHVVISEVQIKQNEFVELYNPTDSDVDMTGWYWCYFSHNKNWNNPLSCQPFSDEATIPAHGYYLIGLYGSITPTPDWQPSSHRLNNNNGAVAIFSWNPKENETAGEAEAGCIDAVGWKQNVHTNIPCVYEGAPTSNPAEGKSIVRKTNATGVNPLYGNAWDTDNNNNDFVLRDDPNPQNSCSGPLPPLPELSTLILISIGLVILVCIASFKRSKSE